MTTDHAAEGEFLGTCPRCQGQFALRDLFAGGRHATVVGCLGCGGLWMRESDLRRLSEVVVPVLTEWRDLGSSAEQNAVLHCPECDGAPALEKLQSDRDSRVILDRCQRCGGVWVDTHELRAIQEDSLMTLVAGVARRMT